MSSSNGNTIYPLGSPQDTRALLNNVLAQVAAESILDGTIGNRDLMSVRLVNGPNHFWNFPGVYSQPSDGQHSATQSTDLMLDDFFDTWTVLHQLPNTSSGFSATLLKDSQGNYTLSFRSTESLPKTAGGGLERDGGSGADGEIVKYGFAFGSHKAHQFALPKTSMLLCDLCRQSAHFLH